MQPELLTSEYDEEEVQERAIRRSDLIRARYGTLAKFLKTVVIPQPDVEAAMDDATYQVD